MNTDLNRIRPLAIFALLVLAGCTYLTVPGLPSKRPVPVPEIGFRLLVSETGTVASVRFCLIEHATGVSPAGGHELTPLGQVFSFELRDSLRLQLRFSQLRANSSGHSYSLAVAAYDSIGNNLTATEGSNAERGRVTLAGESGNFILSSTGGDPAYPGSVRVEAGSYSLSGTLPLGLILQLSGP